MIATGCLVQWYEIDMFEEYLDSLVKSIGEQKFRQTKIREEGKHVNGSAPKGLHIHSYQRTSFQQLQPIHGMDRHLDQQTRRGK